MIGLTRPSISSDVFHYKLPTLHPLTPSTMVSFNTTAISSLYWPLLAPIILYMTHTDILDLHFVIYADRSMDRG